jgi:HD superfamily phosphohydrolase YqeK
MGLHERVARAAEGRLPEWARVGETRRAHIERVAELMASWAERMELADVDRTRWVAAGFLHDVLREAAAETLRPLVPEPLRDLPAGALHGPAAAERLAAEGVTDTHLLRAVAYHTLGHPDFDDLGKALYCADFLEPGRSYLTDEHTSLRDRVPDDLDAVTREVARERILHLLGRGRPLREPTVGFWNVLVGWRETVGA